MQARGTDIDVRVYCVSLCNDRQLLLCHIPDLLSELWVQTGDAEFRSINRNPYLFGSNPVNSQFRSINNRIIRSCMRARRFSDCMHVRSTAVSEIRTLDMHARARFQRSNSVMHVFTVMHDQLCMMRALFNTSFTRILLALLLATSQTICTVAIEIVRRSKLRVSGLNNQQLRNHAWLMFTDSFDARITDCMQTHPYGKC